MSYLTLVICGLVFGFICRSSESHGGRFLAKTLSLRGLSRNCSSWASLPGIWFVLWLLVDNFGNDGPHRDADGNTTILGRVVVGWNVVCGDAVSVFGNRHPSHRSQRMPVLLCLQHCRSIHVHFRRNELGTVFQSHAAAW